MKKRLQIANISALIVTVIINYVSGTGIFNDKSVSDISYSYQNYFTPAGYAFSIWGLIYVALFAFVFYQGRGLFKKTETTDDWPVLPIGWWFVLSCIGNCLWIIAWVNDYIGLSVLIIFFLLFCLIQIIWKTRMEIDDLPLKKIAFVWWPFCLYSGWITVATIAATAAWLIKLKWQGFGISEITWTIIMICIAGIINLLITWKRNMREFALVGVWALVAIAVSNYKVVSSIANTAIAVAVILLISSMLHGYKNRNSSPWKQKL